MFQSTLDLILDMHNKNSIANILEEYFEKNTVLQYFSKKDEPLYAKIDLDFQFLRAFKRDVIPNILPDS